MDATELFVPQDGMAITPNDSANLSTPIRVLIVGSAGDVRFETLGGTELTMTLAAGRHDFVTMRKIFATNTTATDMYGFF